MKTIITIIAIIAAALIIWGVWHSRQVNDANGSTTNISDTTETTTATSCSLGDCPFTISESDNGHTFNYVETSRFTVTLDPTKNPASKLKCSPDGIIGRVASEPADSNSVRFEAVREGT